VLERYRFVRAVARDGTSEGDERGDERERDDAGGEHVLYEALPALHHYDTRKLAPAALARTLGAEEHAS
jgi:hypothetical protein